MTTAASSFTTPVSRPVTMKAAALRVGDEIVSAAGQCLKVLKLRRTPEHVRLETEGDDRVVDPGWLFKVHRRAYRPA